MSTLIQVRRGTTAQWAAADPVLAAGEPGQDTTTGAIKFGNGSTPWSDLGALGGSSPQPEDFGLIGWSLDPANADSTVGLTTGVRYLAAIVNRSWQPVSRLTIGVTTAATSPTAGQNWGALYGPDGVPFASGELVGTNTIGTASASWTAVVPPTPWYWACVITNNAGVMAALRGSFVNSLHLFPRAASQYRWALNGTGQTSVTSFDPAANTAGSSIAMVID